jgi:type IV secretory pathway TrbL component
MRLTSAPISHSFQSKGPAVVTGTGGIINTMQNSGTNIVYNPGNISGISILDTIKELQKQIDELKSKTN